MKNPVQTFDINTKGRDFVIGDLHGSFSAFLNLLKHLNFNPLFDRIFSVGDLVDRGPDSLKCLSLIRESWFFSVLANHEKMMIDKFSGGFTGAYWFQNGGGWGREAWNDYNAVYNQQDPSRIPADSSVELIDLIPLVEELPYLITINTKSGKKFHILHAELPNGANITDERLADPAQVMMLARVQRGDGDAFLWSRNIFDEFHNSDILNDNVLAVHVSDLGFYPKSLEVFNDNLSHIISGHTIVNHPLTVVGQTNIDTGAYGSYWEPLVPYGHPRRAPNPQNMLTCIELDTWTFYQATETVFKEVTPVVISHKDVFGR
jgi:hypothetical protein